MREDALETAALIADLAAGWAWIGLAVALVFLVWGVDRVEPNTRGAYIFRALLIPGVVLVWPLVLRRWWVLERGADNWAARHRAVRRWHGPLWWVLGAVIAVTLVAALTLRDDRASAPGPERLEAPQ